MVALQAGDLDRARISYRDALLRGASGNDVIAIFGCLLGLALCSTAQGELETAAVLHGVVDTAYRGAETVLDPTETAMMGDDRQRLREALGDTELTRLMEQGGRLTVPEAIEFVRVMRDSPPGNVRLHAGVARLAHASDR
jgi:hypothetical protein